MGGGAKDGCPAEESSASAACPGPFCPCPCPNKAWLAVITYRQKRSRSLSPGSSETHATRGFWICEFGFWIGGCSAALSNPKSKIRNLKLWSHWFTTVVLPK